MTLRIHTPPAAEPVTVDEIKLAGRITGTALDARITSLIPAARRLAESLTGRALILQTWECVLDAFPENDLRIGMLPIQSVTSVKYFDPDGVLQTMDPGDYVLDVDTLPGWLLPAYGVSWPATRCQAQAVTVRFVAGYGNTGADVPAELKEWITVQVCAAIEHPTRLSHGNIIQELPRGFADALLDDYRIRLFA